VGSRSVSLVDRLLAAFPLVTTYLWLLVLHGWEASRHPTPWVFIDEIKLTRIARGISEHIPPTVMGERTGVGSLAAVLMAPAWWLSDVGQAYAVAKWIGVACMTATLFPAYGLARMVVGRWPALVAATGAIVVPALAYSMFLVEEPYAYPFATLCFFLIAKALVTHDRRWVAAAVAAALLAPLVRNQLAVIPAVFALTALILAWRGERLRRWRAGWTASDWVGFGVLLLGASVVFNAFMGHVDSSWLDATGFHKGWIFSYGVNALGMLAIGLAVFPLVATILALAPGKGRLLRDEERVFAVLSGSAALGFVYYAGIKGAYIRETFSNTLVERNVIYLAPLLFIGAAMFYERPTFRPRVLLVTVAVSLYLVLHTPTLVSQHYYYDATGAQVLQWLNRTISLSNTGARVLLLALLFLSCEAVLLVRLARPAIARAAFLAMTAVVLAWCLTGELNFAQSVVTYSRALTRNMAQPRTWIDQYSNGHTVIFLGANLNNPAAQDTLYEAEFWNRSIVGQWTIDGASISPTRTPNIDPLGHVLYTNDADDYYLTTSDVDLDGTEIVGPESTSGASVQQPPTSYYKLWLVNHPLRLAHTTRGLTPDGWASSPAGGPATVSYSQFVTPAYKNGYLSVTLSRKGGCGKFPVEHAVIRVGRLGVGQSSNPIMKKVIATSRVRLDPCIVQTVTLTGPHARALKAPLQATVTITPTYQPHAYDPRVSDSRWLGAQVSFDFIGLEPLD
jgi:hypothetical protein